MALERLGKRGAEGFTLIQLVVTMGIIAILATIAIPGYLAWRPKYQLRSAARDIVSNFQLAKYEAVRGNTDVVISFSPAPYFVTRGGENGSYIVFVDNGDGAGGIAGDDIKQPGERLLASEKMPPYVSIRGVNFSLASLTPGFNSRGLPLKNRIGNVRVTNTKKDYQIVLSAAGNITIQ